MKTINTPKVLWYVVSCLATLMIGGAALVLAQTPLQSSNTTLQGNTHRVQGINVPFQGSNPILQRTMNPQL